MHHEGMGVPRSYPEAMVWCRRAAEQQHTHAQYMLGLMHFHGRGVPQSHTEAMAWFRKAAEKQHAQVY